MFNPHFSFVILTYNEKIHLPRLLNSIKDLKAQVFVLDSGSTDGTIEIASAHGATVVIHGFENHPKQWDYALKNFHILTTWTIGLDADQVVSPELFNILKDFDSVKIPSNVNGIYFNRKNYFKGRWIKHGGYFPKYLLKMFRTGIGFSDTNENMDHRFIVPGKTLIWKSGYILEENLKENEISFWIEKHNRYSDFIAQEEIERYNKLRNQIIKPDLWGTPDQNIAFYKKLWWKLPLFFRPFAYFFYRYFFLLGFLDGIDGSIFHYLQAFWFRLIVDIKIYEIRKSAQTIDRKAINQPALLEQIK